MDVRKSARCVSGYPVTLFKPVGFLALLLSLIFFGSGRVYAQDDDLTVIVDGRQVAVEAVEEAELDGRPASLDEVLAALGPDPVVAQQIVVVLPPFNDPLPSDGVEAVIEGHKITLTNLDQTLAAHGQVRIWIGGTNWRICILIRWASELNPHVTVDGRVADVNELTAEFGGSDVEYEELLALLGSTVYTDTIVELFDPVAGTTIPPDGVAATVQGNTIAFTGLTQELAARGRIGIWVRTSKWRVCVVISWSQTAAPVVTVDGQETAVESLTAQIDHSEVGYDRLLALIGTDVISDTVVELFDPADNSTIPSDGVTATVEGNEIALTGLSPQLAARGRIGVWVSGTTFGVSWRICVVVMSGKFTSDDDRITLDFAASQVHTNVIVTYVARTNPTQPTPVNTAALLGFQLTAENGDRLPITRFDRPYVIRIAYTDEEISAAGIDERTLQLAYWDEDQQEWVTIPTQVDAINNVAIGTLDHMTEFVLWGSASGPSGQAEIWLPIVNR